MTSIKRLILSAIMIALPVAALAHPNEGPVAIEISSSNPVIAGKSTLTFQMVNTDTKQLVTDKDLNISHQKILHMVIYDPSLREFQHIHPQFTGSADATWTVDATFTVNGYYWVWAQGELATGSVEFSAPARLSVISGKPAWPAPPNLSDIRKGDDSGSVITLSNTTLTAGKQAMLNMIFSRKNGSQPQLSPYLGDIAHVIAASSDGDSLEHVHPMAGSTPTTAMLHVTFPEAGYYKLWVQFIDGGVLKTVPLSVQVN